MLFLKCYILLLLAFSSFVDIRTYVIHKKIDSINILLTICWCYFFYYLCKIN